ncbi:MAG: hypothetical protein ACYDBH_12330 [Acidobacteriaceae bacterium]
MSFYQVKINYVDNGEVKQTDRFFDTYYDYCEWFKESGAVVGTTYVIRVTRERPERRKNGNMQGRRMNDTKYGRRSFAEDPSTGYVPWGTAK